MPASAVRPPAMSRTSQIERWMPTASEPSADRAEMEGDLAEVEGGKPGRRVRADRVEGDVAEVEQARVADDDVQADRHHREDEHDHHVPTAGNAPGRLPT